MVVCHSEQVQRSVSNFQLIWGRLISEPFINSLPQRTLTCCGPSLQALWLTEAHFKGLRTMSGTWLSLVSLQTQHPASLPTSGDSAASAAALETKCVTTIPNSMPCLRTKASVVVKGYKVQW